LTQYAGVIQSYCDTGKLLFIFVDVFFSGWELNTKYIVSMSILQELVGLLCK
jgi:hypothetical protein